MATVDAPHISDSFRRLLDILDWSGPLHQDIDECAERVLLQNPAKVVSHVLKGPVPKDYLEAFCRS